MKSLLSAMAITLLLAPAAAIAQGCDHGGDGKQAQISCAQGQSWDVGTSRCVTVGS